MCNQQYPAFPFCMNITYVCRFSCESAFSHQPCAEQVGVVGVQSESDRDDDFKCVHIRVQPVFKLHVATQLVVVKHVRLADCLMAAFTAGTVVWNSPAISVAVIHTSLPVTADRLVLYDDYVTLHGFSFLDGTTCKFLDAVQLAARFSMS